MDIPIRPTRSRKGTRRFLRGCVWLHRGAGMYIVGSLWIVILCVSPIVVRLLVDGWSCCMYTSALLCMTFGWVGVVSIDLLFPGGFFVVRGAILDATTWPGTIENQAGSLGFRRCILGSAVQGESGTRCCFVVCDSVISWGLGIMFVFPHCVFFYYCCGSCTPWSLLLTAQF